MRENAWKAMVLTLATTVAAGVSAQNLGEHTGHSLPDGDKTEQAGLRPASNQSSEHVERIRASDLIGVNVTSKLGESLGEVQDLVVDPKNGRVQFALIGKGFMAGLGERVIPLPWQALNVHSQQKFVVSLDHQKLQDAPAWSDTDRHQGDYVLRIYRFYELEPETGVGGTGQGGEQSGTGQSSSDADQDSNPNQQSSERDQFRPDDSAPEPDK